MKASRFLKSFLFMCVAFIGMCASAQVVQPGVVTIGMTEGCGTLNQDKDHRSYVGFYYSSERTSSRGRAYLWVNSCNNLEKFDLDRKFSGRQIYLELKRSSIGWDPEIVNFSSVNGMLSSLGLAPVSNSIYRPGIVKISSVGRCSTMTDSKTSDTGYIPFTINEPDDNHQERVYFWVRSCNEVNVDLQKTVGARLYLELKPSQYSPGHWDRDIANFDSIGALYLAAVSAVPEAIEFMDSRANFAPDLVTVKMQRSENGSDKLVSFGKSLSMIIVDKNQNSTKYYNSNRELALTQSLTPNETSQLLNALSQASESCPIEVTMSRSLRRITRVAPKCAGIP